MVNLNRPKSLSRLTKHGTKATGGKTMLYQLILSVVLLLGTGSASAAALPTLPQVNVDTSMPSTSITKTVCASGCNYTNDQLQQAIDEAQLGTTITLQPGVTYTPLTDWGFILKNKISV